MGGGEKTPKTSTPKEKEGFVGACQKKIQRRKQGGNAPDKKLHHGYG